MKSPRFLPLLSAALVATSLIAVLSRPVAQEKSAPTQQEKAITNDEFLPIFDGATLAG